jgi:antitoxin VapB
MDERELSIDSTEAYDIAESLSERLGKSTTEIVLDALRRLDRETGLPDVAGLTPERRAEHERFMALVHSHQPFVLPGATSDHRDMYDEFGLPDMTVSRDRSRFLGAGRNCPRRA